MALMIIESCTACDACEPVCPNKAISAGNPIYVIDPMKCTECIGAEDEPQCKLVCPADCMLSHDRTLTGAADSLARLTSRTLSFLSSTVKMTRSTVTPGCS